MAGNSRLCINNNIRGNPIHSTILNITTILVIASEKYRSSDNSNLVEGICHDDDEAKSGQ